MKTVNLFLFIFLFLSQSFGQKADIDSKYFNISNCALPLNYIEPEKRMYKTFLSGTSEFTGGDKMEAIKINGWTKVSNSEDALFEVKVNVGNFNYGSPNTTSKTTENKDKDGKVTSKTTTHTTTAIISSNGELVIVGIKNEMPPMKKDPAKETKSDKKKQEKEKEMAANPFLKNVDLSTAASSTIKTDEKSDVYTYSLVKNYEFSSGNQSSSYAAIKYYEDNIGNFRNNSKNDFRNNYVKWVNNFLNSKYGYGPVNNNVRFKTLGSKKHPEYEMFNAAVTATGEIFKKMRYNKGIDEIKSDLIPILQYFDDVAKRYAGEDKDFVKLRGAAIYNQARINQYLDNHDKVLELTKELVLLGKKNEKASARFEEESKLLKEKLAFHNMKSRHIGVTPNDSDQDDLGETVADEDEEGDN
jgi:hypothetical protein